MPAHPGPSHPTSTAPRPLTCPATRLCRSPRLDLPTNATGTVLHTNVDREAATQWRVSADESASSWPIISRAPKRVEPR